MTYLTKIKFSELNGEAVESTYGYQETPGRYSKTLLHLYDENGEQLDGGNGFFPNAKFEAIGEPIAIADQDDFWNAIESERNIIEREEIKR